MNTNTEIDTINNGFLLFRYSPRVEQQGTLTRLFTPSLLDVSNIQQHTQY